jgi:hypothetical protein
MPSSCKWFAASSFFPSSFSFCSSLHFAPRNLLASSPIPTPWNSPAIWRSPTRALTPPKKREYLQRRNPGVGVRIEGLVDNRGLSLRSVHAKRLNSVHRENRSRPLTLQAKSKSCVFCRENLVAGLELYGGLGTAQSFGLNGTSRYLGPIIQFNVPKGPSIGFEPSFGLNASSVGLLWRFRVSYEGEQIFSYFRRSSHNASRQVRWINDAVVRRDGIPVRGWRVVETRAGSRSQPCESFCWSTGGDRRRRTRV